MGISTSFDLARITNLETRMSSNEVNIANAAQGGTNKVDQTVTTQQTIPNLKVTQQLQVTGGVNGIVTIVDPATNGSWMGIMQDATLYNLAIGRFNTGSKGIEIRAYQDNLTIRTGRAAGAVSADFNVITNDQVTAGINQRVQLMPRGVINLCPQNGGLNTNGLQLQLTAAGNPALMSINAAISPTLLKFGSNGIQSKSQNDVDFMPFFASAFNVTSDISFKNNVEDYAESALDHVKKTKVRKYRLNSDRDTDPDRIGLVRHEAPAQLKGDESTLDLYQMCSMLWKSVQELSDQVEQLQGAAK